MSIERKRRVLDLLEEALEIPSAERRVYLEAHCDDAEIRREVEAMLETEPHTEVLGAPVFSVHDEDAAIGRRLGSYEIVRLLDRGGMGSVYLAKREDFDQQVALKLLRRGLDLDESLVRRFHNERQILAHLDHPNIAKLLDGGTTEDRLPYFVMELVDGVPIDRYCEQNELSLAERLALFRKVCTAVQFAHRNLVVHRDLKPSNVLITAEGEPKLLDFGIAKLLDDGMAALTLETAPGHGAMTPRYASPEQIRLEPVTTASDVYSLGVLLYELLTGRTPYRLASDRSDEVARAVCEQEPEKPSTAVRRRAEKSSDETLRDPRKLRQLLAGDLDSIVLKALRKRPEMRYGSVEQFSEDVHRYLSGLPVDAREGTGLYRFGKFVRRNMLPLVVVTAFVLLIIASGVVSWHLRGQAEDAKDRAIEAQSLAESQLAFLKDLIKGADPNLSNVQELTALQLLQRGKDIIPVALKNNPEAQIELLGTIGELLRELGDLQGARDLMVQSLELAQVHYKEDSADIAKLMNNLGVVYDNLGEHTRAQELFRKALAIRTELGQEERLLFRLQSNIAGSLMLQGKFEDSRKRYLDVLEARKTLYEPDDQDIATSLRNLGAFYLATDEPEEAEFSLKEALRIREKGTDNALEIASVLDLLGRAEAALGKTEEAKQHYEEALGIRLERLGEHHYRVARTRTNFGTLLISEDPDRARELLDKARDSMGRLRPEGRELPEAESAYGELLAVGGNFEEAEGFLRRSYQRLLEVRGPESTSVRAARQRIEDLYNKWDRPEKLTEFLAEYPPSDPEQAP